MNYSWIAIWLSALTDRSWVVIQLVGMVRHLLTGIRLAHRDREQAERAQAEWAIKAGVAQVDLARALRALSHPITCSCPDCLWATDAAGGKTSEEPAKTLVPDVVTIEAVRTRLAHTEQLRKIDLESLRRTRASLTAANARIASLTERAETAERQTEEAMRDGAEAVKGWKKTGKKLEAAEAKLASLIGTPPVGGYLCDASTDGEIGEPLRLCRLADRHDGECDFHPSPDKETIPDPDPKIGAREKLIDSVVHRFTAPGGAPLHVIRTYLDADLVRDGHALASDSEVDAALARVGAVERDGQYCKRWERPVAGDRS